jgi:hypothetical protein
MLLPYLIIIISPCVSLRGNIHVLQSKRLPEIKMTCLIRQEATSDKDMYVSGGGLCKWRAEKRGEWTVVMVVGYNQSISYLHCMLVLNVDPISILTLQEFFKWQQATTRRMVN